MVPGASVRVSMKMSKITGERVWSGGSGRQHTRLSPGPPTYSSMKEMVLSAPSSVTYSTERSRPASVSASVVRGS